MEQPRPETLEMIVRECLRMRRHAIDAGLDDVAFELKRLALQAGELLTNGHEPRPDPPALPSNVVTMARRRR